MDKIKIDLDAGVLIGGGEVSRNNVLEELEDLAKYMNGINSSDSDDDSDADYDDNQFDRRMEKMLPRMRRKFFLELAQTYVKNSTDDQLVEICASIDESWVNESIETIRVMNELEKKGITVRLHKSP